MVVVKELDTTERGTKGFGSSDTEMNKQVGTGANLLTKSPPQNFSRTSLSKRLGRDRQETPRPGMMTQRVRTSADLLTNPFQKITRATDHGEGHNPHKRKKSTLAKSHRKNSARPIEMEKLREL